MSDKKCMISWLMIAMVSVVVVLSACSPERGSSDSKNVTVMLKWLHQSQFAGMYVAAEKGLYQDHGLDVRLVPYDMRTSPIQAVIDGDAQFGVIGADELVRARSRGLPVKAVAVVYKINPAGVYTPVDSGIWTPDDFIGRRIGIERAADGSDIQVGVLYYAMMKRLGINRSDVEEVTVGYHAQEVIEGSVDASAGYVINEPYFVIESGKDIRTILFADYGVNIYADVIFTTDDVIEQDPDLVRSLVAATVEGWRFAIENEEQAVEYTHIYAPQRSIEHEAYMMHESIPFIHSGVNDIGVMDASEWGKAVDLMVRMGMINESFPVEDLFTNEFVMP